MPDTRFAEFTKIEKFLEHSFYKNKKGFLNLSRFYVDFTLSNKAIIDNNILTYNVNTITMPSYGIADTSSIVFNKLGARTKETLTISFFESNEQTIKNYFNNIIEKLVPYSGSTSGGYTSNREFIDDYFMTITVMSFNNASTMTYKDSFIKCLPIRVSNAKYSLEAFDEFAFTEVVFTFRSHSTSNTEYETNPSAGRF